VGNANGTMRWAKYVVGLGLLIIGQLAAAQANIGDAQVKAGGLLTGGYSGDYGDQIPSTHSLNLGLDGNISGSYYNPNFLNFTATPYFNQSHNNSTYQSITGASGIATTVNLFTGTHYPGTVSYHYDHNSTGTFGLLGQPNFTTYGNSDGFAIGWSALVPDYPSISASYSQGSGSGTIYGTDETSNSENRLLSLRSGYQIAGFRLNGLYDHTSFDSKFPAFLAGRQETTINSNGQDFGFGANHNLPINGSFYANFNHASVDNRYLGVNDTNYTNNTETAGATFHPTTKLALFVNESYSSNLSGLLSQSLVGTQTVSVNLGSGAHSMTLGGGANYQFTPFLWGQAEGTRYNQSYFGKDYTGTYVSGTLGYSKKLFNMLSFSATVIDSDNGQGTNSVGFIGNVNFYRSFGRWQTSGRFSYAQNVQTLLITYTTSYYNYGANVHRKLPKHMQWTAAFSGTHSGLNQQDGNTSHSETFSTTFGARRLNVEGNYSQSHGLSILGGGNILPLLPTPGLVNSILFDGTSYGGGISGTPLKRMVLSASFSRAISNTTGNNTISHNNTEMFNTQLQYHLRRIGLQAGYTRFLQGISAAGLPPANTNAFFVGVSRWFDFF
jgi:hypothetical protein